MKTFFGMDLRRVDHRRYTVPMLTDEQRDPTADIQPEIVGRFDIPEGAVLERGPEESDSERDLR